MNLLFLPYILIGIWVSLFGICAYLSQMLKLRMSAGVDALLAVSLILFAGLRGASLDYDEYIIMFETVRDSSQLPLLERALIGKDLLFGSLLIFVADFGFGAAFVFLCSAIMSVGLKAYAFRKAFGGGIFALFVLFCTYYYLHDFTQIRASISIAFCFCALVAVVHRKRVLYLVMCFLALGFHAQAGLFIACTAPLFLAWNVRFALMIVVSSMLVILAPILLSIVLEIDGRAGIATAAESLSFNAVFSAIINLSLLLFIFIAGRKGLRDKLEYELSLASMILVFAGFAFLVFTFSTSIVLAWRMAEMFMCFGVFVVVAALLGSTRLAVTIPSFAYCVFNIVLLVRGNLLVEYQFSEDFLACCALN